MLLPLHRLPPLAPHHTPTHPPPRKILSRESGHPHQHPRRHLLSLVLFLGLLAHSATRHRPRLQLGVSYFRGRADYLGRSFCVGGAEEVCGAGGVDGESEGAV